MAFVDRCPEQLGCKPRRAAAAIVDPDLDRIDFACSELADCCADLGFAGDLVRDVGVCGSTRPRIGCADTTPGDLQSCPTHASGLLIRAHAIREVAFLDALRHDRSDAEVQRALEVRDDVFVRVVLGRIREVALEPRMHVRADKRRHDGLAREIDAMRAGWRRQLTASADVGDDAALDDKGGVFHRCSAVAGNQACALVERRGPVGRARTGAQQGETENDDKRASQHGRLPERWPRLYDYNTMRIFTCHAGSSIGERRDRAFRRAPASQCRYRGGREVTEGNRGRFLSVHGRRGPSLQASAAYLAPARCRPAM